MTQQTIVLLAKLQNLIWILKIKNIQTALAKCSLQIRFCKIYKEAWETSM